MLFVMNASGSLYFGVLFYDAPVRVLNTTLCVFSFDAVFYDALARKIFEAPMLYSNTKHQAGVYGVHGSGVLIFCAHQCFRL